MNVGIDFLWESTPALNECLSFNYGGRVGHDFAEYSDIVGIEVNASFQNEVETFTNVALEKVKEYRKFTNWDYAKEKLKELIENTEKADFFWELYNLISMFFLDNELSDLTLQVELLHNGKVTIEDLHVLFYQMNSYYVSGFDFNHWLQIIF